METKKKICLLLAVLLSLSGVLPAVATDYQASDYLPLAVGNSWTYYHLYYDLSTEWWDLFPAYWDQWPVDDESLYNSFWFPEITITVERKEIIDGKTYYVISNMPMGWPPAPPYFIAGKKLRWEGKHLMVRTTAGEEAIFRFDGPNEGGYRVGNKVFTVGVESTPVPKYVFEFEPGRWSGSYGIFLAGYGIDVFKRHLYASDHPSLENKVEPIRAVLGGVTIEYEDALVPTASLPSSWGQIKQSWLAGERGDP